jgi:hypothetical protein
MSEKISCKLKPGTLFRYNLFYYDVVIETFLQNNPFVVSDRTPLYKSDKTILVYINSVSHYTDGRPCFAFDKVIYNNKITNCRITSIISDSLTAAYGSENIIPNAYVIID